MRRLIVLWSTAVALSLPGCGSSRKISCEAGYRVQGGACVDIDECTEGTAGCSAQAACANTPGSFTCTCDDGYSGDGVICTPIDACLGSPCGVDAQCASTGPGAFECSCPDGYDGDPAVECVPLDACQASPCPAGVPCALTGSGTFSCGCPEGSLFNGADTCVEVIAAPAVSAPGLDAWPNGAVVYEIFVRSFADSNGDGHGDLQGLIDHLDYLNDGDPTTTTDLGVDAIWLMPVFSSPSTHGYDTTDYETINADYGTNDDFATLVQEAHRRGIRVLLDFVMNHSSTQHSWFQGARSSTDDPHHEWYVWSSDDLHWTQPWSAQDTWYEVPGVGWYYALFWSEMPDLNFKNASVRDEITRLAQLWLDRGADGFRLDAVPYLVEKGGGTGQLNQPESHAFLKSLSASVRGTHPEATLAGEVWWGTDIIATYYGDTALVPGGDELPLLFDFPLASALLSAAATRSATQVTDALAASASLFPAGATDVPFLTNHDMTRTMTALAISPELAASAAGLLLTLPGTPFVYYGEELGMQSSSYGGDGARTPMPWTAATAGGFTTGSPWTAFAPGHETANVATEARDPSSLLTLYRGLIRARHLSGALARGDLTVLVSTDATLAYLRQTSVETVLVVHDLGDTPLQLEALSAPGSSAEKLWATAGASLSPGVSGWTVSLPAHGVGVWRLRP